VTLTAHPYVSRDQEWVGAIYNFSTMAPAWRSGTALLLLLTHITVI